MEFSVDLIMEPAWVAFEGGDPVGSVSLIEHNMDTRRDLTPWLAALFVLPDHRGHGIGAALDERLGCGSFADDRYEGRDVVIMSKVLERSPEGGLSRKAYEP